MKKEVINLIVIILLLVLLSASIVYFYPSQDDEVYSDNGTISGLATKSSSQGRSRSSTKNCGQFRKGSYVTDIPGNFRDLTSWVRRSENPVIMESTWNNDCSFVRVYTTISENCDVDMRADLYWGLSIVVPSNVPMYHFSLNDPSTYNQDWLDDLRASMKGDRASFECSGNFDPGNPQSSNNINPIRKIGSNVCNVLKPEYSKDGCVTDGDAYNIISQSNKLKERFCVSTAGSMDAALHPSAFIDNKEYTCNCQNGACQGSACSIKKNQICTIGDSTNGEVCQTRTICQGNGYIEYYCNDQGGISRKTFACERKGQEGEAGDWYSVPCQSKAGGAICPRGVTARQIV